MSTVVIFDPNSTPNDVLQYLTSVHTPDYQNRSDVVIDPDVSSVVGQPLKYWKHVAGSIVQKTAQEKTNTDNALASALVSAIRSGGKVIVDAQSDFGILQRAFADISKDEINNIRQWIESFKAAVAAATSLANLQSRVAALPSMPDRTLSQLRTAIQNRIDSGVVDS